MDNAAGELRAVLPARITAAIDWSTLRLETGHHTDPALKDTYSDLVYSARLAGHTVLLYVLFEHQSSEDPMMALRLLRYMLRVWDAWLSDNPNAKNLPAIVPVVLTHAEGGWRKPVAMRELYDAPAELLPDLLPHLPDFRFVLDDLTATSDDELMARALQATGILGLLLLRHAREERSMTGPLLDWLQLMRAVWEAPDGRDAFRMVVQYVMLANKLTTIQDLVQALVPVLGPGAQEVIMTEGQRLIEQGRIEGEARGEARGVARGRAEGRAASVLTVLAARGLAVSPDVRDLVMTCDDIATLDRWIVRAATAASAEDAVFDK